MSKPIIVKHDHDCNINFGGMCNCMYDEACCPECDRVGCRLHSRKERKFEHLSNQAIKLDCCLVGKSFYE
jgi:hypothetical protein